MVLLPNCAIFKLNMKLKAEKSRHHHFQEERIKKLELEITNLKELNFKMGHYTFKLTQKLDKLLHQIQPPIPN